MLSENELHGIDGPIGRGPGGADTSILAKSYEVFHAGSRCPGCRDSRRHLRAAAQLRAVTGIKTPDTFQGVAVFEPNARLFSRMIATSRPSLRSLQLASDVK